MVDLVLSLLGVGIILKWLDIIRESVVFDKKAKALNDFVPLKGETVSASIIVPARNEEAGLGPCLRSLQQQDYGNIEVILVNDRSTDRTGELMRAACAVSPRWRYLEITELPAGWLGKNHAMSRGAAVATGDYVLFTDADILFAPQALRKALGVASHHQLDHLVWAPAFRSRDLLLSTMQCFFSVIVLGVVRPSRMGKSPNYYIGSGAFNLLRRSFYESFGGHTPLRLEVIDDIMLGKVVARAGGKQGFQDGKELISVEWYADWRAMIRGLEKNGFAAVRFSWWGILHIVAMTAMFHLIPYVAVFFAGPPARQILIGGLVLTHLLFAGAARAMGYSVLVTFLIPVGAWLMCYAHLRSAVLAWHRGGVEWRGTRYELKELRAGMV